MKHRLRKAWAAGAMALFLMSAASGPVAAAADTPKEPAPTSEQQKPATPPPEPKKPEEKTTEKSATSGAKQAGREVSNAFKKFGKDVGDFFDGLFH